MDNLRERIDEFHEFDHSEVEDIVREIASLDNIDDKMSLFKSFYTKAITILNGDDFNEFKEILETVGGLSKDEIADLDPLKANSSVSLDNEDEIAELETELADVQKEADEANLSLIDYLNGKINELESNKSEEIKNINEQVSFIHNEIEKRKKFVTEEDLKKQIENLRKEQKDLVAVTGAYPSEEDERRYHEINNIVKYLEEEINLRSIYKDKSLDDLLIETKNLTDEQKELWRISMTSGEGLTEKDQARFDEINRLLKFIGVEKERKESSKYEHYTDLELKEMIEKLDYEQQELWRISMTSGEGLSEKDQARFDEITVLLSDYRRELQKRSNNKYIKFTDDDLRKQIEDLRKEQKDLVAVTGAYPSEEDERRYHEINDIVKKLEEELEKRKNDISRLSDDDLKNKLIDLEKQKKSIQSVTDKKVEELKGKLRKAEKLEKLKAEKREKKPIKKEYRRDLLYKGLAGMAGFVVGMGLSSVPGVGAIRMTAATAKLTVSGVHAWTNKHPGGKVAKIVDGMSEKINDIFGDRIASFRESHPKIAEGVSDVRDRIVNVLNNDKFNIFVNGMSLGYVAGNLVELASGKTIGEHLFSGDKASTTAVASGAASGVGSAATDISLEPGQVFDISGISEGLSSSTAENAVSLLTERGKEAVVDKFVTLPNGEVMVHFKQINGAGYAWFKESVVKDYLAKAVEVGANVGKTL